MIYGDKLKQSRDNTFKKILGDDWIVYSYYFHEPTGKIWICWK